ncbi:MULTISPECIES: transposase [unclassified Rhizobium]|uniref:transposase n=1 Tax=unclassified Rhizobium TaxID=2613769 RepID=UPI001AD97CCA|nr:MULTISPECIES: transposase [unclassified Rhizobium]MBO9102431.1 transposase [Rhizobium sp. L58/93]MBO9188240.1 transposase [Rhizobium sp. E27B/91]QXZ82580.1 transposase [Rhizobium sp. K1/93]QXZ85328.1 transposase [Rhizobium sp. K1/93]QXZ86185.1 transposase [Rhizobium sp. K1/93]
MSEDMNQGRTFEILTADPVRTRRKPKLWSDEEKSQILEEALAPGANVSAVARAHGMDPSQLFGWRRIALASGSVQRLSAAGDGEAFTRFEAVRTDTVEIKVGDATLRVSASIDPALLSGIVRAVRQA